LESFEKIPLIFREPVFERALETAEIAKATGLTVEEIDHLN
jgi:hypothetical protein